MGLKVRNCSTGLSECSESWELRGRTAIGRTAPSARPRRSARPARGAGGRQSHQKDQAGTARTAFSAYSRSVSYAPWSMLSGQKA
jgi:hypothetical protein